jgi:hypothetical protein
MRPMTTSPKIARTGALAALVAAVAMMALPGWSWASSGAKPDSKPSKPEQATSRSNSGGAVVTGTGIVQAISGRGVLVRQLDGSDVRVIVGARTLLLVNGTRGSLADVRLGAVAKFTAASGRPALVLRITNPASRHVVVQSVTADAVIATSGGTTVTIPVGERTRVLLNGRLVTLLDVKPGDIVVNGNGASAAKKPVRVLRLRRLA